MAGTPDPTMPFDPEAVRGAATEVYEDALAIATTLTNLDSGHLPDSTAAVILGRAYAMAISQLAGAEADNERLAGGVGVAAIMLTNLVPRTHAVMFPKGGGR